MLAWETEQERMCFHDRVTEVTLNCVVIKRKWQTAASMVRSRDKKRECKCEERKRIYPGDHNQKLRSAYLLLCRCLHKARLLNLSYHEKGSYFCGSFFCRCWLPKIHRLIIRNFLNTYFLFTNFIFGNCITGSTASVLSKQLIADR